MNNLIKTHFDKIDKLCKNVSKYKTEDEDGELVSVAFSGNCGIFAWTLLNFIADHVPENVDFDWKLGFFFDNCETKSDIYDEENAELNHVVLFLDNIAFDGSGILSKSELNSWYGKMFTFDNVNEIKELINDFTVPSVSEKRLWNFFEKEWAKN